MMDCIRTTPDTRSWDRWQKRQLHQRCGEPRLLIKRLPRELMLRGAVKRVEECSRADQARPELRPVKTSSLGPFGNGFYAHTLAEGKLKAKVLGGVEVADVFNH